jgi:16S rRNA (cytidine1402-2'-O)-methyltransferase
MGKLVLVPTPIGNLGDISLRAIETLQNCTLILAEDSRVTSKLLQHYGIHQKIVPFHAHNEHKTLSKVIERIQENDTTVLVSDAGTPGISDPGFLLVRECIKQGIHISCLPGPVALIPALVGSGLPCDKFVFEGFLPHKKGRQSKLQELAIEARTIVLYESPHRLKKCLGEIATHFGEHRQICVVREISKIYEEFIRGTAREVCEHFVQQEPKGEIVIIIAGYE